MTTTDAGIAAPSDEFSQSVGPDGPPLLQDHYLIQTDREHLVTTIVGHIKGGVTPQVLPRVFDYWTNVSTDLGARVRKELNGG